MSSAVAPRSGGRPTAAAAALLETTILDHATVAFLRDGYAATSIEAIARDAHVAKRTIYTRWEGKPALFLAVARRLMTAWLSLTDTWPETDDLQAALHVAARSILDVGLTPEAIALHRMMIAEGDRFPELQVIMDQAGAQEGMRRIARILARGVAAGQLRPLDTAFAAEQFLHLILAGPQRRALGLRTPLDAQARDTWREAAVRLFLSGCLPRDAAVPGIDAPP
ncbi:TetR/AcrR family transcriptional regulator [Rhodopila sp.]|uniref:TetR/AcrR family transcriptional regulator n=1 Tax=Rhodopila sp. TaxID=2480087 RepID=UPI003D0E579A